jgi:hypothetical protein
VRKTDPLTSSQSGTLPSGMAPNGKLLLADLPPAQKGRGDAIMCHLCPLSLVTKGYNAVLRRYTAKNRREKHRAPVFTGLTGMPPVPSSIDGQSSLTLSSHPIGRRYRLVRTARRFARPIGCLTAGTGGDCITKATVSAKAQE